MHSRVLTIRGSYDHGFVRSGVLMIRGSYDQRFKSACLTWLFCAQMLILIVKSYDQGSMLMVNSHIQCVSSAYMLKLTSDFYCVCKILHLGVGAQMLTSIVNVFLTSRGLTFTGSYNQGSKIRGFSSSGVLTIKGFLQSGVLHSGVYISVSHDRICDIYLCIDVDRCSLHSGVQISVSYMTGLCQDVDIDRKILRSGSVLIVNFYIQCVSCAQMLIMT